MIAQSLLFIDSIIRKSKINSIYIVYVGEYDNGWRSRKKKFSKVLLFI